VASSESARDMKPIIALVCAALIGSPAIAADFELRCRGELPDRPRDARPIGLEFGVSISGSEVTLHADPKYGIAGTTLILTKSDPAIMIFESVERIERTGDKTYARIFGIFFRPAGRVFIHWQERSLIGDCELLVGTRNMSRKVT
jgi:hypothetical protein